jgi:hypothetical protein
MAADAIVEEVLAPGLIAAGATHPPFQPDVNGRRVVSLRRRTGSNEDGVDVNAHLVEQGWAYVTSPFTDRLVLEVRALFVDPPSQTGLWNLPAVRAMAQSYAEDAERVLLLEDDAFQAFGERVLEEVADWLGWQPAASMFFRSVAPDAAREVFLPITEEYRRQLKPEIRAWFVERGLNPEQEVRDHMAADAWSPVGPTVFVLKKGRLSQRSLRVLLVHEIMHQYQEETICAGMLFPPHWVPNPVLEAHAELLAASFLREHDGLPEAHRAMDYITEVMLLEQVCRSLDLTADEIFRRYLEREWGTHEVNSWHETVYGMLHIGELLLALGADGALAGLSFSVIVGSEGQPMVEIRNTLEDPFHGQFSGVFTLSFDRDGVSSTETWSGPPWNLALAPQSSIRLLLDNRPLWTTHPPRNLIGLFSPTWQAR